MKKSFTLFLSLFILALYYSGSAQTWTQSGPSGGNIVGITSTSTHLFAGAKNEYVSGGLWTSSDNGLNWNSVIDNIPGKIVQAVSHLEDTLFVATTPHQDNTGTVYTDGGIFRSVDNGLTWTQPIVLGTSTIITCFYPKNNTTIFAGSNMGPYRSVNNGLNWTLIRTGLNTGLSRDTKSIVSMSDTIFIGTRAGVYRSLNNGTSWTIASTGISLTPYPNGYINGLARIGGTLYASTLQQGVFKSIDRGASWVEINSGLTDINLTTIYASGSTLYAATLFNGIFKSSDGGSNWVQASLGLPDEIISCMLQSGSKLFAGGQDGIYETIDNGLNWTSGNSNLAGHMIGTNSKNIIRAGNYLFAGTYGGRIYRSADDGSNWQPVNGTMRAPVGSLGWTMAMGSVGSTVFVSFWDATYRSSDWGNSWSNITAENAAVSQLGDMASLNSRIFATNGTLMYSDDAGLTWNIDPDNTPATKICVKEQDVFVSSTNTVSRSVAGTGTFTYMGALPAYAANIFCLLSLGDTLYAGTAQGYTGQGVFKSVDNGVSWSQAGLSDSLIVGMTVVSNKLYARTNNSVMQKSTTNDTWEKVSTGLPFNFMGGSGRAMFGDNGFLYTAVAARSIFKADVTQFAFPAQPDPISGSATPCVGSTLTYSVTNVAGVTYAWQFPSDWVVTAGGNTNSVTVVVGSESGTISVTPSTGWGAGPSQLMTVSPEPYVDPAVTITVDQNNICAGTLSTFTATITGGGITPIYQWFVNGVEVGENSSVYAYIAENNDVVDVQLTSSLACVNNNPVQSNAITLVVNDVAVVTAVISVVENSICDGGEMAFYATTTGGGDLQEYNWLVNNISAGVNAESFIYTPADGDLVSLIYTSSEICTTENPVESNTITAIVNEIPEVSWTNSELDTICLESTAFLLTGGLPEGGTYTGTGVIDNTFYPSTVGTGYQVITYTFMDGNSCSNQDSLTLFVDVCSGVSVLGTEFIIYPNPASENITITLGGEQVIETISLFNSMGAKAYEIVNLKAKGSTAIPVQDLPSGSYFLRIVCSNQIFGKTVIVQ